MATRKMTMFSLTAMVALTAGMAPGLAGEVTTIEITSEPLVKDVSRLGINIGRAGEYCGASGVLKKPRVYNFEGTSYRQCHFGELRENGFLCNMVNDEGTRGLKATGMDKIILSAKVTILSGPHMWKEVRIKEVTGEVYDVWNNKRPQRRALFLFDRKLPLPDGKPIKSVGIMIDNYNPDSGNMHAAHGYWNSKENKTVAGDTPPGSFGRNALLMDGSNLDNKGSVFRIAGWKSSRPSTWHLRLWVKSGDGAPSLTVQTPVGDKVVPLTAKWEQHDLKMNVKENVGVSLVLNVKGGSVLLDDIELWREAEKGENPTPFTDDFVEILKNLNPGTIRSLQMGGTGVDKDLRPRLQSYMGGNRVYTTGMAGTRGFNLHHMYKLCEYLDCEPWYNIPGTLYLEDIDQFMEFIGAPADVGWGKVRAAQGHPKPWAETLRKIHVEFGNEAWNYWGPFYAGGYDGPDYWKALLDRAKQSPYYKANILFHVGLRGLAGKPVKDAPNADRYTLAPYIVHQLHKQQQDYFGDDWSKAYRYLFAQGIGYARRSTKTAQELVARGYEISIYEINHHFATGDADVGYKNTLLPSIGAGLNIFNSMMLWMKENHARQQSFFTIFGISNTAYTNPGVRLFGACLNMRKGQQRYRPHWQAIATANRVIAGDLVETKHSAGQPTFVPVNYDRRKKTFSELDPLPVLWSYAFADGKQRGLIVVNIDTKKSHTVKLKFADVVDKPAKSWSMTSASINANNELDNDKAPEVKVVESKIDGFKTGHTLALPAHSMTALQWEVE